MKQRIVWFKQGGASVAINPAHVVGVDTPRTANETRLILSNGRRCEVNGHSSAVLAALGFEVSEADGVPR